MKKLTLQEAFRPAVPGSIEKRPIGGWWNTASAVGRNQVAAECPFCGATVGAYTWSIAGNGFKRCDCGAMLLSM